MYDIPEAVLSWITDFLTDRKQRVNLNSDCFSEWGAVPAGVPQGTKLGPWPFAIMINDLDIPGSDLWKYVDDTTVSETISKVQESNIQNAIDTFSIRATVNKFELNEPKCKELRISFSTKPASFDPIVINGKDIDVVPTAKLLGLTLSGNLKWNNHVDEIVKKSRKKTPVLSLPAESFRFENSRTDPLLQDSHSSNYRVRMPHVPRQSNSVSVYRH